jgi:predicted secreted protein
LNLCKKKQPTDEQILSALNEIIKENKTELKAEKVELALLMRGYSKADSKYKSCKKKCVSY